MFHLYCVGQSLINTPIKNLVFRILPGIFLIIGFSCSLSLSLAADGFTVRHIPVDTKGSTAAGAREAGLVQAQTEGLQLLMQRLTSQTDHIRLPTVQGNDVLSYVESVTVEEEKNLSSRYVARFSVRYNAQKIRSLLQSHGISYVEPRQAIVTLPVLVAEGRTILWEDPNPWRQAWAALPQDSILPLIVPLGEIEDVSQIPTNRIDSVQKDDLENIMERYGATDTFIVTATVTQDISPVTLHVTLREIGASVPNIRFPSFFTAQEGESFDVFLERVAINVQSSLVDSYKTGHTMDYGQTGIVQAVARFSGLAEWQSIRERLERIPAVRRVDIELLGRSEAYLSLQIVGTPSVFPAIFSQHALNFLPNEEGNLPVITSLSLTPPPANIDQIPDFSQEMQEQSDMHR